MPQLIQSRAQFGFYGALLPNFLIWLIFLGYIVGENVLAAQALAGLWHITYAEAMVIACFVTWLVVFFGYRIMHDLNRVTAVLALILFAVLLVRLLQHASGATIDMTAFHFSTWLLFFSINVSGQVGWAPYVSDYSRYLPSSTSIRQSFWYTYSGQRQQRRDLRDARGGGGHVRAQGPGVQLRRLPGRPDSPGAAWLATIVLLLSIVAGNAINLYSPLLAGVAIASKDGGAAPGVVVRGIGTAVIMAVTGYLATVVSANFVLDVSDFISFLLYIVIPWSAINLVDYYLVRHGRYDVGAIFEVNGRYGSVNWRTVLVFLVGLRREIPFMNAAYPAFEGPAAKAFGGADISWLVGFVVAGGLYYLVTPRQPRDRKIASGATGMAAAD